MIYLFAFGMSAFFAFFAKKSGNKSTFIFLSVLSILVTVLLAALRDVSVGIDTKNYYNGYWAWAYYAPDMRTYFSSYLSKSDGRFDFIFLLLARIIAKTTGSFHIYLFVIHLLIISCVYIGAFRLKRFADPIITLLLFYLLYYNHSLNISRQYISMALLFSVVADLEQRKFVRFFLFSIISTFFHISGVFGLLFLALYYVMYPRKRLARVPFERRVVICFLIVLFTVIFVPFLLLLLRRGFLSKHFAEYLSYDPSPIPGSVLVMLGAEVILLILSWRKIRACDSKYDFFLFCSLSFLALYQIAPFIAYGKRIAAYFSFTNIITLGASIRAFKYRNNKLFIAACILGFSFIYWFYFYYLKNGSQTMPYILDSDLLRR